MKQFILKISIAIIMATGVINARAQEKGKIFFTTAVGLINAKGNFGKAFKSTVTFNSGVE